MRQRTASAGALLALVLLVPALGWGAMYKWTDAQGETHYSQFPPPVEDYEVLVPPPTPSQDPEGANKRLESTLRQLEERRNERLKNKEEAATAAAEQERREQNCQAARSNLTKLQSSRHRFVNAEGVATYLPEDERQARIAEARKQVEENCD